ncbi:hypothetical protein RFI_17081, partial [Reticulomyxa filosa]
IVLWNKKNLKVKTLQVGNPKKLSLEFNVYIQWYNNYSEIETNCVKYCCFILNNSWHFRTNDFRQRDYLSNCCSVNDFTHNLSEFNSFQVIHGHGKNILKKPFNLYSITLKQGLQHLKNQLQMRRESNGHGNELVKFECKFNMCHPQIPSNVNENILLSDIYKYFYYLNMQVYWKINYYFIVPYKNTISASTQRTNIKDIGDINILSNRKPKFNPLLCYVFDCFIKYNALKELLHEVITNGYLIDLILYHDDIHKQMGYPLQLHEICAILLYCGKSCNVEFSYDQTQFQYSKWKYLDTWSQNAIIILHSHEEESIELYCGLRGVRLENEKEIKEGYFISHVSTSDDIQIAKMYRSDQGCILHFHPSMRRAQGTYSCDVSWISPFKHEREILFARSYADPVSDENKSMKWCAKIENENENTQIILLTWIKYDQYIQQVMHISKMWNHSIDLNLIYRVLLDSRGSMDVTITCLNLFEEWKKQSNNVKKYEEKKKEFIERRCCNHHINLFIIFFKECLSSFDIKLDNAWIQTCTPIECATIITVKHGLPLVEKT